MFKKSTRKTVKITKMLQDAKNNKYAIAHININNLEWIKSVLDAVQETNTPVILGVSEGAAKYMCGFKNIVQMVENVMEAKKITQPVALHLDHGSYSGAIAALKAGFSSVMFDGSSLPFNENLFKLKKVIALAKRKNASVEAEVGGIGGQEDGVSSAGELADVSECETISKQSIACLAAGIGNIHGIYPSDWKGLNFKRLSEITRVTNNMPLVLHGGTGIPTDQIKKAIELGIAKINVNTECQLAFAAATRKYIEENKDIDLKNKGFDPRKLLKPGCDAIKEAVIKKFKIFGCLGKA